MSAPTKSGFNRVAWITPYAALILGLGLVTLIVRTWKSRPFILPSDTPAPVRGPELDRFREQARKETEI
jgi:cytochrome c-type biogenesis protein CcmH/NrfF